MDNGKLNICLISREFPPDTAFGGIASYSTCLVENYKRLGHDVTVFSMSLGDDHVQDYDGVPVHRVKVTNRFLKEWYKNLGAFVLFFNFYLYRRIRKLHRIKPFDVIDTPEHLAEGLFPALHGKIPTVTRYYTPFSMIVDLGLNAYSKDLSYYLIRLFEKLAINRSTLLTSPSQDLVRQVEKYLGIKREVEFVPDPVDIETFRPSNSRAEAGPIKVLFVGRLEDRKGIHSVADAVPEVCRRIDSCEITLIGRDTPFLKGYSSAKQYLMEKWQAQECLEHVTFIDHLPREEMVSHYQSHDIVWVPSLYDNSPFTCLEAMACGKPVIGSDAGGIPEYFGSEETGILISAGDSAALAKATVDLAGDPDRRNRIGRLARERVVANFAGEVVSRKTIELYRKAIAASRRKRLNSTR